MWNYFFNTRKRKVQEESLAPETKPVIGNGRLFIIRKDKDEVTAERISYKLIKKRRREHNHKML